MPTTVIRASHTVSRRRLLWAGAASTCAAGAVIAAAVVGVASASNPKISQQTAGYQDKPEGKAQCDVCSLWQPPASCKTVTGAISPSGWCNLYDPKT
jgi:hypothetical protein